MLKESVRVTVFHNYLNWKTETYKGPTAPPSAALMSSPLYRPPTSRCTKASRSSAGLHLTITHTQREPRTPSETQDPRDAQRPPEEPPWDAWTTGLRATSAGRWSVSWSAWEPGPGWTRASAARLRPCRGWSAPSTTPSLSTRAWVRWRAWGACRTRDPWTRSRPSRKPLTGGRPRSGGAVALLSKVSRPLRYFRVHVRNKIWNEST